MTQAQVRFQNFEDYLSFDDGTEIGTFQGSDRIFSSQLTNINLTPDQIFIASQK